MVAIIIFLNENSNITSPRNCFLFIYHDLKLYLVQTLYTSLENEILIITTKPIWQKNICWWHYHEDTLPGISYYGCMNAGLLVLAFTTSSPKLKLCASHLETSHLQLSAVYKTGRYLYLFESFCSRWVKNNITQGHILKTILNQNSNQKPGQISKQ